MSNATARLGLPVIAPSQAQKHITHNEALQLLDTAVQLVLSGVGSATPPAVPNLGDIYALGSAPTGDWAGQAGKLAQWIESGWNFVTPQEGWRGWDQAGAQLLAYHSGDWGALRPDLDNVEGVGIGTTSDATNRLAVAADASLFSHSGSDHQMKINKASAGDTASLLYQSNWTGHAEMGLSGDTDFRLKVSPDGNTWTEALVVDGSSGHVSGAAVQESATDMTPGRLARADYAYGPGNLLGTVGEVGGVPTGAVIERGTNANGEYARFADGTQICCSSVLLALVSGRLLRGNWTLPAAFVGRPAVLGMPMDYRDGAASGAGTWTAAISDVSLSSRVTSGTSVTLYFGKGSNWGATDAVDVHVFAMGRWF